MKNNQKEKTILKVTLLNAGVNVLLAIIKIVIGSLGFSQALIADGIHSLTDLLSDALVFFAARASMQHPDKEHPYGHQRIETIATLIIAVILFSVALSISYEAILHLVNRIFFKPTYSVVIVAIFSIIANECLFRYSHFYGKKIHSNLLISNAWHKRSDVFVSLIVLLSVIGSIMGWHWLDAIGAIIISTIIFKMSFTMIWQSVQELIDRGVDEKTLEKMIQTINSVPGVRSIHQLRTRMHGTSIFVDLHIIVDPFISVSEGHHIGEEVHAKLLKNIKHLIDVTVHIDPENDEISRPSLHLPNREAVKKILAERWTSLPGYTSIKKMTLHYLEGHLYVEIYLPYDTSIDIGTTETLTIRYREAIKDIPDIMSVVIHRTPK